MGEMRNNTAEAMIFPGREDALHLRLEKWVGGGYYPYYHHQYDVYLKPEIQADRMNCLLYPGETGVAMFSISLECSDRNICKVESEELSGPPPQLGMRLISYEAFYRSWEYIYEVGVRKGYKYSPEIHPGYHPPAENLEYEIRGENMVINYDLEIALPDLRTAYLDPSWIILYDEAGKIINILRTDLRFEKTSRFAGKIHIYGIGGAEIQMPWETPTIDNQWWEPMADLSEADWGRISRIRVFNELADFNFCYKDLQSQHG
ncbi:MAG: hypothetical protein JW929_04005 [Anaerolineales bacterium]|nr:hypothetical protein [Anaerolineales bacterium]